MTETFKELSGSKETCEQDFKIDVLKRLLTRRSVLTASDVNDQKNVSLVWSAIIVKGLLIKLKNSSGDESCYELLTAQKKPGHSSEPCWKTAIELLQKFKQFNMITPFRAFSSLASVSRDFEAFKTHCKDQPAENQCSTLGALLDDKETELFKSVRDLLLLYPMVSWFHYYPFPSMTMMRLIGSVAETQRKAFIAAFIYIMGKSEYFKNYVDVVNKVIEGLSSSQGAKLEGMKEIRFDNFPLKDFLKTFATQVDNLINDLSDVVELRWKKRRIILPAVALSVNKFWEGLKKVKVDFDPYLIKVDSVTKKHIVPMSFLHRCEDVWTAECATYTSAMLVAQLAKQTLYSKGPCGRENTALDINCEYVYDCHCFYISIGGEEALFRDIRQSTSLTVFFSHLWDFRMPPEP